MKLLPPVPVIGFVSTVQPITHIGNNCRFKNAKAEPTLQV